MGAERDRTVGSLDMFRLVRETGAIVIRLRNRHICDIPSGRFMGRAVAVPDLRVSWPDIDIYLA